MATIAENLQKLANSKAAIKQAISDKGGTITDSTPLDEYATAIDNLPSGDNPYCEAADNVTGTVWSLFGCLKSVTVPPGGGYSLPNSWGYWTGANPNNNGWSYSQVRKFDFSQVTTKLNRLPSKAFYYAPENLVVIGDFSYVTSFSDQAFYECRLSIETLLNQGLNINSITSIGSNCFYHYGNNFSNTYELIFPNAELISYYTSSSGSISDCSKLTKVHANSTKLVNTYEYKNCTSLNEIVFGSALTQISFSSGNLGNYSSSSPSSITTLTFKSTTPPTLTSASAFDATAHPNLVHIYVPSASVSAYQAASNWLNYASIISADPNE